MTSQGYFLEFFDTHVDDLFRHALMRLADREKAVSITRKTFETIWQKFAQGSSTSLDDCFNVLDALILDEYLKRWPAKRPLQEQKDIRYGFIRTAH